MMRKFFKFLLWLFGTVLVLTLFFYVVYRPANQQVWGINFSPNQARYLGVDPKAAFQSMLDDLSPKKIRLVAYWETLEPEQWQYDFAETDWYVQKAEESGVKLTLVLGRKQPRWPECHVPEWYKQLNSSEQKQALLSFISATVKHYQGSPAIERWQVENEPFFNYGPDCSVSDPADVKDEIHLVKSLDQRPVVVTDSGEKGAWFSAVKLSDLFGTTLYRKVDDKRFGGQIVYPLPPAWYRVRAGIAKVLFGKKVIDVELQAEPWFSGLVSDFSPEQQMEIFSPEQLTDNLEYSKRTGLPEHYLWGAEWWYYMKVKHNQEQYWQIAQKWVNN